MGRNYYFSYETLKKLLSGEVYNYLMRRASSLYSKEAIGLGFSVIDLEGIVPLDRDSIFSPGEIKRFICVFSYYFSHGYSVDENGRLKKQYEPLDKIPEDTLLSDLIDDKNIKEWLNKRGYNKVGDILEKSFSEFLQCENTPSAMKRPISATRWFKLASKLAGHGYVFSYGQGNGDYGRISVGKQELFPKIEFGFSEKDKNDCLNFGLPFPLPPDALKNPHVVVLLEVIEKLTEQNFKLRQDLEAARRAAKVNVAMIDSRQFTIDELVVLVRELREKNEQLALELFNNKSSDDNGRLRGSRG